MQRPPPSFICTDCGDPIPEVDVETCMGLCVDCLADMTCLGCGAIEGSDEWGTVGDGFDGYCPKCADKREANKEVELG